jgi:hypothetical protein
MQAVRVNFRDARMYGRMAEAALDDIGLKAGNAEEGIQLTANQKSLQEAHTFSRALNDTFTRAFAGDVLARKKSGAKRLPPELLANSILTGGGDATAFKMAQLEDAATFMAKKCWAGFCRKFPRHSLVLCELPKRRSFGWHLNAR